MALITANVSGLVVVTQASAAVLIEEVRLSAIVSCST
jgi:hypothetical protein